MFRLHLPNQDYTTVISWLCLVLLYWYCQEVNMKTIGCCSAYTVLYHVIYFAIFSSCPESFYDFLRWKFIESINYLLSFIHFLFIRKLRVKEFLKTVGAAIPDSGLDAPPLTCGPNDSLGSIIEKIASRYVHRIYVMEGTGPQVIGVITLRDIISCFITEPHDFLDSILRTTVKSFYEEKPIEETE